MIEGVFKTNLKKYNFKKKNRTWRRDFEELIQVINLQKSAFGNNYYINLAIWFNALGDNKSPTENLCHLRIRLSSIVEDKKDLEKWLDFNLVGMNEKEREVRILEYLEEYVIPFMEQAKDLASIKQLYKEGAFKKAGIRKTALEIIQ